MSDRRILWVIEVRANLINLEAIVSQGLNRGDTWVYIGFIAMMIDQFLVDDWVYLLFDTSSGNELVEHQIQTANQYCQLGLYFTIDLHKHCRDVLTVILEAMVHVGIRYFVEYACYLLTDFHKNVHVWMDGNYFLQLPTTVCKRERVFGLVDRRQLQVDCTLINHPFCGLLYGGNNIRQDIVLELYPRFRPYRQKHLNLNTLLLLII